MSQNIHCATYSLCLFWHALLAGLVLKYAPLRLVCFIFCPAPYKHALFSQIRRLADLLISYINLLPVRILYRFVHQSIIV